MILTACGQGNEADPEPDTGQPEENDQHTEDEASMQNVYLFYPDEHVEDLYRVERSVSSEDTDGAMEALNLWLEGPESEETSLTTLTNTDIDIQSIEDHDGVAHVSFSPEFLELQVGSGTEEMLLQQVALIMDQFGFEQTQILIDGEIQEQLFGHLSTDEPITAEDPESYELVES